jgi:hypothetical protein
MGTVVHRPLFDRNGISGTHGNTPVACHALSGIYPYPVIVQTKYSKRAVFNTSTTKHALLLINLHFEFEGDATDTHETILPMTGSPARGMVTDSISVSMVRIAASSLEI